MENQTKFIKIFRIISYSIAGMGTLAMLIDMFIVSGRIISESGFSGLLSHGVLYHKIGELLIAVPFMFAMFYSFAATESAVYKVRNSAIVLMVIGSLLNLVSWNYYKNTSETFMINWTLMLTAFGIFGPIMLYLIILSIMKKRASMENQSV